MRGRLLIAIALVASATAWAADDGLATQPYFHDLSAADGLPSSTVRTLAQDHDGYIWIGTADGLARYDGVGFRIYRHHAGDPASLSGEDVTALLVDRDDRLWCGGEDGGLNLLDAKRREFRHFRHDKKNPASLSGNDIWAIGQDASGAIWTGSYASGLNRLAPDLSGFAHFHHDPENPDSPASDTVLAFHGDAKGNLWIGSDVGIDVRDRNGHFNHVDFSAVPGEGRINAITFLADGKDMLAGTRRGVVRIGADLKAKPVVNSALGDQVVYGLARDRDGALWIATRSGLDRLRQDGRVDIYRDNIALSGSLKGKNIFDALTDRAGGLWFALIDGGVAYLPSNWGNFALFRNDPGNPHSLSGNTVEGLAADALGHIWAVGLDDGIDRLDPRTGKVKRFGNTWPLAAEGLWSVLVGRDQKRLWIGHGYGLRVYDLPSGRFHDLPVDRKRRDALAPGTVDQLAQAADGSVWASASGGGLQRIDPVTLHVTRYGKSAGLRSTDIGQIGVAPDGALLVASAAGLDRYDAAANRFVKVAGAPARRLLAFAFATDGTLWLHDIESLLHYRYRGARITALGKISQADGWPSLTAGGMQIDARGEIWVSSARGLWRVDPATRKIRKFGVGDGLASAEFNRFNLLKLADGSIYGGTLAGIVGFQPSRIATNVRAITPVVSGVWLQRKERKLPIDWSSGEIRMRWDDHELRVSVRELDYANPKANRYQWRLAGFDTAWVDTQDRGERDFSQLPPGDFRLLVRAAGPDGHWSEPIEPFHVRVSPPPWATVWAYAAYALAIAMMLTFGFHTYRARVKRRHAFELAEQQRSFAEQASAAKTEFLATMGHEIRTPMTGVLGMTELLLRTRLDTTQHSYAEAIQDSGHMMLRLVNDSLDLARIEAGKVEFEDAPLDLHATVREVATLARPLAQSKDLKCEARIDADAPLHVRGDRVRIKQILLNLVNNAIKFTERGHVDIGLRRVPDGVEFSISDSGPGISESTRERLFQRFEQAAGPQRHSGSGLGLAICRELVARMGGTIGLESTPGMGSVFRVVLPLPDATPDIAEESVSPRVARKPPAPSRRFLLVEDDATVAAVVSGLLQAQGHRVAHAANGLAALAELETGNFDVVLIDLDLPGIDGLALARMLRERESSEGKLRLPLIGISARSRGDEEAECLAAGMDAFLRKPLTGEMLAEAIS